MQDQGVQTDVYQAALDALPIPVIVNDSDGIIFVNQAAASALRAKHPEQLEGKRLHDILHRDCLDAARQRREFILSSGCAVRDVRVKMLALDGSCMPAIISCSRIMHGGRPAVLVTGVIQPPETD